MTPTEKQLFHTYYATIQEVASKLRYRYVYVYSLPHGYYEDFQQELLLSAPCIILINNLSNSTEVHKFLLKYYGFELKDYCKQLRNHLKKQREPDNVDDEKTLENIEDKSLKDKTDRQEFLEDLPSRMSIMLKAAPQEIRQLCQIYLKHGTWCAATLELGWSKGKVYRVQMAVIRFFSERKTFFWGI